MWSPPVLAARAHAAPPGSAPPNRDAEGVGRCGGYELRLACGAARGATCVVALRCASSSPTAGKRRDLVHVSRAWTGAAPMCMHSGGRGGPLPWNQDGLCNRRLRPHCSQRPSSPFKPLVVSSPDLEVILRSSLSLAQERESTCTPSTPSRVLSTRPRSGRCSSQQALPGRLTSRRPGYKGLLSDWTGGHGPDPPDAQRPKARFWTHGPPAGSAVNCTCPPSPEVCCWRDQGEDAK